MPKKKRKKTRTRTTRISTSTTKTSATRTSKSRNSLAHRRRNIVGVLIGVLLHDLRTPLTSLLTNAQLMRDEDLSEDAAVVAQDIATAGEQLDRMLANTHDLLTGQLAPARMVVPLQPLFDQVRAKHLSISADAHGARVSADPTLLRRVLLTLIDNSLHYAPEGSPIVLAAETMGRVTRILIADAAKPVPDSLADAVFEMDGYLDRAVASRGRVGLGFGLWFCRVAVEAMAGRIEILPAAMHQISVTLPGA